MIKSSFGDVVGLIPARFNSSRLPGKALADLCGLPMIIHVAKRAALSRELDSVVVCTDDERITRACLMEDIKVCITPSDCQNGTERIAKASKLLGLEDQCIVIDIQGDEPLVDPKIIDQVVCKTRKYASEGDIFLPHVVGCPGHMESIVKVVESEGLVLYLSRGDVPIGFHTEVALKKHLSIIGFTMQSLARFCEQPMGKLERIEGIELLRAIESGMKIRTFALDSDSFSVDTPRDLIRAREYMDSDALFRAGYD